MLETIKALLGLTSTDKDELLSILIEQCTDESIQYTHNSSIPDSVISQMVVYKYNLLGTEGLKSESYSGVSFSYSSDYPDTLVKLLKSYRKVQILD